MNLDSALIKQFTDAIQSSRKYRLMKLPDALLNDILASEAPKYSDEKDLENAFRKKLHEVVAPYLEDINYAVELENIAHIFQNHDQHQLEEYCRSVLARHASTHERIPYLKEIYLMIFSITGDPHTIVDLACGLHPFGLPWMGLSKDVQYYAYDIHKPRIDFINSFFLHSGMQPLAVQQDILVTPPKINADVTFLFKEAHRIQKRKAGANFSLWKALKTEWLVVSLPSQDLKGHHDLSTRYRRLVIENNAGNYQLIHEFTIGNEMFYFLKR